ncbi:MAG: DUF1311 domain-containing protein [Rhodobiaceae bacterium]|nr:DUF1311 domain-containing protein [Rhodobiaceae bacterium]MCC0053856.1 DUF1311 domain-containing protein [Rhodobiaceae bacterium]
MAAVTSTRNAIAGIACGLALAFGITSTPAQAACEDAGSNVEIGACLASEYERADKELNRVWKLVQQSIDASDYVPADQRKVWKKVLLEAQRGWIKLKENDCLQAVPFEWYGGSGAGIAATSCALEMTEARTKDLKQRYGID